MKTILLILLLLIASNVAFCQKNMWGLPPEKVIEFNRKQGGKLIQQETGDGILYLAFQKDEGEIANFIFKSDKLVCIMIQNDTKIIVPATPHGQKELLSDGKLIWIDHAQNTITTREYEDRFINDMMGPMPVAK